MKRFMVATAIQLLYCVGCIIVMLSMSLYYIFYPTVFSDICFRTGALLTLIFSLNPMGLIATVINYFIGFGSGLHKSKKVLIWLIVSPFIIVLCWFGMIVFFVGFSGGV